MEHLPLSHKSDGGSRKDNTAKFLFQNKRGKKEVVKPDLGTTHSVILLTLTTGFFKFVGGKERYPLPSLLAVRAYLSLTLHKILKSKWVVVGSTSGLGQIMAKMDLQP